MKLPYFAYLKILGIRLYMARWVTLACPWVGLRFIPLSSHMLTLELPFVVVATHAENCSHW